MSNVVKIKKLEPHAKLPRYALAGDAGLDFFCLEGTTIQPGERHSFRTGIAMELPGGYVGLTWDRSGHSLKRGLKVFGGVIDSGYRGEVLICLYNSSKEPVTLEAGYAIAQILIQKAEKFDVCEVVELSVSERGENGFSSTGL